MAELLTYKCPCCGGMIEFNSNTQTMQCPYCDTEFDLDILKQYDDVLNEQKEDELNWEEQSNSQWGSEEKDNMLVYTCQSCGGAIVADKNTAATSCPYCGNPVVMTGKLSNDLRPDYVIPFKLDKKSAVDGLKKHLIGKRLLPKIFKDENHIEEVKGIYVPYWIFSADVDANISYRAKRIRRWSDRKYNYTETSFFSLIRDGNISFANVPVDASSRIEDNLMESIEPFDFSEAVDFQTAYLSGYFADRYDVNADTCITRANERMKTSTENAFAATTTGYLSVTPEHSSVRLSKSRASYALYPVWMLVTSWKGKKYTFAMNGQTGKFVGDLPIDKKAYWKWFSLIASISAAAAYALLWWVML